MRILNTTYKYLLCFFLLSSTAFAIDWDTKGIDFWLTFPPNLHMNKTSGDDRLRLGDSLFIFITSDEPTTGVIEYTDLSGNVYNKNFSIADPSEIYIFRLCYLDYELLGYNDSGILGTRNHSENVKKQYFHVSTDKEVTVYAHSQAFKTSDACLVLPTDILGKDYFVMSYNSDGTSDIFSNLSGSSTPSQFVVLGTEDNTKVTIIPSTETQYNGRNIQNIFLNKGEAYLVQARIENSKLNNDLTGTEIHSDKPLAVFAGHQRANVPVMTFNSPSRDFLFEEMPSIETWGKNALLIPYVQPSNITKNGTDLFRILSAYDNTDIYINGVLTDRLNKGEFYEGRLVQPAHVEASAPMLVAQFKKTSDYGSGTILGDPFEMLIPPVEQFMTSYRVLNTQVLEYSRDWFGQPIYQKVYTEQYIAIVAPNSVLNNVLLDGNQIPGNSFLGIPSTTFSYANISVTDGVHTISSIEKIGVYVYGYGQANSYGYVGGMYLRILDLQPPLIVSKDSCETIIGEVHDTLISDSRLKEVKSPVETQKNVNVFIENFSPYSRSVKFKAYLIDFQKDGEFEIEATDSIGLTSRQKFTIRGFTIDFPELLSNSKVINFDSTIIGDLICDSLLIRNTGLLPFTFDKNLYLNNNIIFSIPASQLPVTINPGAIEQLKICFAPTTTFPMQQYDTLIFGYNCFLIKVNLNGISKPKIEIAGNKNENCNIPLKLTINELPGTNFLGQNYPNPVTDNITEINFGIESKGNVTLKIYDFLGNETKTLFSDLLDKGVYQIKLDCSDFSQGIYIIALHTGKSILSKTMVIRK